MSHIHSVVSARFTRPADTTAYASGDLVANSTTAASVVPMSLPFVLSNPSFGGIIRRARILKSGTGVSNANFRVHLFDALPAVTNGDNGVFAPTQSARWLGSLDVSVALACSDGAVGQGAPVTGAEIVIQSQALYALLEARGAYTPISSEVFTVFLEVSQNR